jgi:hypothetical protein
VALTILLQPYVETNRDFHRSYRHEVILMLPTWQSWLSPPPASMWADLVSPIDGPLAHEHHLFPGAVFYILFITCIIGSVARRRAPLPAMMCLATAGLLTVISMKFGKTSCWHAVHDYMPGAGGIRAVSRIFSVVLLFGWIGVLITITDLLKPIPRVAGPICAALLSIAMIEQFQPRLPAFNGKPFFSVAGQLAGQMAGAKCAYVQLSPEAPYWTGQLVAMWAGLKANVPVINGYSGRVPAGYPDETLSHDLDELSSWIEKHEVRMIAAPQWAGDR